MIVYPEVQSGQAALWPWAGASMAVPASCIDKAS